MDKPDYSSLEQSKVDDDFGAEEPYEIEHPNLSVAAESDPSEKHPDRNEDSAVINKLAGFIGVFDGVSGCDDGRLAASLAAQVASKQANHYVLTGLLGSSDKEAGDDLTFIFREAHYLLKEKAKEIQPKEHGTEPILATTGTIAYVYDQKGDNYDVVVGNVGDSRAYLFADGHLRALTIDHSLIQREYPKDKTKQREIQDKLSNVVNQNELSQKELELFRQRNIPTMLIGNSSIEPDIQTFMAKKGDRIVLLTDGITDPLTQEEIEQCLQNGRSSQECCNLLIEAAKDRNNDMHHLRRKRDDKTVAILQLGD